VVLHVYLVLGELEKGCSEILVFFFFLKFIYIYIYACVIVDAFVI
jgi:hypothetical protein